MSGIRIYLEKENKSGASSSTLKEGQIERKIDKKGNRQWHEWLFLFRQCSDSNLATIMGQSWLTFGEPLAEHTRVSRHLATTGPILLATWDMVDWLLT